MKKVIIALCFFILLSCKKNSNSAVNTTVEFPTKSETIWSKKTELFVEFPALVLNKPSKFAAHFTVLNKHKAVTKGQVTVSIIKKGKVLLKNTVNAPSSPGIFAPVLTPTKSGNYQLVFDITTPNYKDQLIIEDVIVYNSTASAIDALGANTDKGGIPFLKEQAWKMDFQTAPVVKKEVYKGIPTFGIWQTVPDNFQNIVATTHGKISYVKKDLTTGSYVKKGETIMRISGQGFVNNNIHLEIKKAKATFNQFNAIYERKKQLYENKIISKADWEKVVKDYNIAKNNYANLTQGYATNGKLIKAPISGYLQNIATANGNFVSEGTTLFSISNTQSSVLKIQVSANYAQELQQIQNIQFQISNNKWSDLKTSKGKILSIDKAISTEKPMLNVYVKVNSPIHVPVGSISEVTILVGTPTKGLVIPYTALLEDYGNFTVIVQSSGERFEKRQVTIGKRNGNEVAITSGVYNGEYVVTKGAYQVKTAAMSGQAPAHGHAH